MGALGRKGEYAMVQALRFALWCQARRYLLDRPISEAAGSISAAFGVSRATGYRWLAAWREVNEANLITRNQRA